MVIMKIEHYSFGKIIIDGKTYTSDVIIYPDHVDSPWWRKEGHNLHVDDLTDAINTKPEIIIVGTGDYGVMVVPEETIKSIRSKGIDVQVEKTEKAVQSFNSLKGKKKAIAALHLTC